MKYLAALQKKAPYAYLLLLLIGITVTTFYDAGFTFYPVTIWGFCIIFLSVFWFLSPKKNWEICSSYKLMHIISFIYVLYILIGYFIPPFADFGYKNFILLFSVFFIYFTSATIKWEKIHLRWIFHILCISAFILSVYGIYRYIVFPFDRVTGPFFIAGEPGQYFPNAFSFFLILIIPLQILYLFSQTTSDSLTIRKVYFYLSSVVIFTAFFLCFSRASLIALFILAIFFIIVQLSHAIKKQKFFEGKSVQILLVILIISFIAISAINRVRSINYEVDSLETHFDLDATENTTSFYDRFDYMKVAFLMSVDYPLFGVGSNNFEVYAPVYHEHGLTAIHPYNLFLKISSENGLPAGILTYTLIFILFYYYVKKHKDIEQKYYVGALGFALIAVGAQSMLDYNFNFVINTVIFAFFIGLYLSRFPVIEKSDLCRTKYTSHIFVLIITLLIGVTAIHELSGYQHYENAREAFAQGNYEKAGEEYEKAHSKRWFKENYIIQSIYMYELADKKNGGQERT